MSRKWLEKEAPKWVDQEIISSDQADRLLSLYDEKKRAVGILPILGSLLVGIGILTYVAANWQAIGHLWRLLLLIAAMTGFYIAGERFHRQGDKRLGIALLAIGLTTFGGSIFLIVQMYHLLLAQSTAFLLWGAAGVLLTWLYPSRFLFVYTALVLNIAQGYSLADTDQFNIMAFLVLAIGLGWYWLVHRNGWLAWVLGLSLMVQSVMLIGMQEWKIVWFFLPALAMYAAADWLRSREDAYALQGSVMTGMYLFGIVMVLFPDEIPALAFAGSELAASITFLIVFATLLALSSIGKRQYGRTSTLGDWLLLLPWFFIPQGTGLLYLLALCFYSLYVLWHGYTEQWRFRINLGTLLFLFAILLAYTRLAWDFMDKSLFFLLGGVLLLVLSWYLNRRRRSFLTTEGEDKDA
ncbi:DUF2157 domain-containing protein [Paenibacillus sp. 1P07SE]|uniref:DUF2157 domain-containing protein n=1 Tax=Paenibacillus sp. 1P07SE TaxID=3132209 RepID=UPI0039A6FCF6